MNNKSESEMDLLVEIRDLLKSREEKYDLYLKQARESYGQHMAQHKDQSLQSWIWLCVALALAVFFGGLMLHIVIR